MDTTVYLVDMELPWGLLILFYFKLSVCRSVDTSFYANEDPAIVLRSQCSDGTAVGFVPITAENVHAEAVG